MAFGIQVFLCSGRELRIYSQVQPAVLCFAGSVLCNWETQRGLLILQLWQPEISHLCLLACFSHRRDPSVERWRWKCPSSFHASFLLPVRQGPPSAAKLLPPVFTSSAPLFQTCRGQGAVKFYKEELERTRHRLISQCTQVPVLLWLCSCWQKPPAMTHPSFWAWPWGREQICPAWRNSLHNTKGRKMIFTLSKQSDQEQGSIVQMKQAQGSTGW